jgi:hypothetical protein
MKPHLPRRWKRWTPLVIGVATGGAIVCGVAIEPVHSGRVAIAREAKKSPDRGPANAGPLTCQGGEDYPAAVRLVPDAVVAVAGREAVEYHAEIDLHKGTSVGLAWEADVVDDRGQKVASKLAAATARGKKGDNLQTAAILAQLPDGYYMLRVRVAVSPDNAPATVMQAVQYVNVSGGKWREMDDVQWRADSNAQLAFRATTPPTKRGGR